MSKTKVILIVIAVLFLGMFLGRIGLSQSGNSLKSVVEPGSMTSEASYIIFTDGNGNYYAKNGITGEIEFSSTNASYVIQSCIDALPSSSGGVIYVKEGAYTFDSGIVIKDKSGVFIKGPGKAGRSYGTSFQTSTMTNNASFIYFVAKDSSINGGGVSGIQFYLLNTNLTNSVVGILASATNGESIESLALNDLHFEYCSQGITFDGFVWFSSVQNIEFSGPNAMFKGAWLIGLVKTNSTANIQDAPKVNTFDTINGMDLQGNYSYYIFLGHPRCNYNTFRNIFIEGTVNSTQGMIWIRGQSNNFDTIRTLDMGYSRPGIVFDLVAVNDTPDGFINYGAFGNHLANIKLVGANPYVQYLNWSYDNDVQLEYFETNIVIDASQVGPGNHIDLGYANHKLTNENFTFTVTGSAAHNITFTGYGFQNSGSWNGTSPVVISHGLFDTPTIVSISVNATQPYSTSWTANSTHITIYHNGTGSLSGSWEANYQP